MITGIAFGSIFLYSITNSMHNVLINELVKGFSLTGASQGMMSSMSSLGAMLALLVAPLIQGRVTKMTVLLASVASQAVSLALCGASPVFAVFCTACALLGVGGGLIDAYTNSWLVDVHKEKSPQYLGYLHGLFGIGSLLTPLIILPLMHWVDWRGVFFVMSGVLFVGVGLLLWPSRLARGSETEQATHEGILRWKDIWEYLKTPRNLAVLGAAFFATANQTGGLVWIVRYMTLRFDAEALGITCLSVYWVCAVINRFSIAHFRMKPSRLLVIGAGIAMVCLTLGVLSGSAVGMLIAMGAFGLSSGHFIQVLYSECNIGYEGKTTLPTAVMSVVLCLGRIVVPLLMASVSASFSVVASMLIPAAMAGGAAVFGWLMDRLSIPAQGKQA